MEEKNIKEQKIIFFLKIFGMVSLFLAFTFFVFFLGFFVGQKKAFFSYRWAENYHRVFEGPRKKTFFKNFFGNVFLPSHGAIGEIIQINDNTLVLKERNGFEKIILLNEKTKIQLERKEIKKEDLKEGEIIGVIGSPTEKGEIQAKFIRVFPKEKKGFLIPFGFLKDDKKNLGK